MIKELDTVVLASDLDDHGLRKVDIGALQRADPLTYNRPKNQMEDALI